jgi:NADP-dependent 3-hydroxy acid dehydrogenase YdfG
MNPADRLPFEPLAPGDIAHAVLETLERPAHVDVTNIVLRPTDQPL